MDYTSTLKTFRAPSISQITLIFDINREFKLRLFFNNVIKHFKKSHKSYISNIFIIHDAIYVLLHIWKYFWKQLIDLYYLSATSGIKYLS